MAVGSELDPVKNTPKDWIACSNVEKQGLFEQCEAVKIIKTYDDRVRVYSLARKKLLNFHRTEVFLLTKVSKPEQIEVDQVVAVPGGILWAGSSNKYQALCRTNEFVKGELSLDCGEGAHQKANPKLIYKAVSSEDYLPGSPEPTLRTKLEPQTKG